MRTNLANRLRAILRGHPDGLSTTALMDMTGVVHRENMTRRLHEMPDAYIDRWEKGQRTYQAVWCIVTPPDDCPHPTRKVVAVRPGGRKAAGQDAQASCEHND